jgi:carbon monoxide dehydrogenase subunit G
MNSDRREWRTKNQEPKTKNHNQLQASNYKSKIMNATITKSFHVPQPLDTVWSNITNPEKIVVCVPGAKLTEMVDDNNFKGEVELKFGPVKASYGGNISFLERNAETKTMKMKGSGTDTKGKGGAELLLDANMSEKDGGTDVSVTMDVTVQGMLAQFGSRLVTDATSQVFDQFVRNFKSQLEGKEVDNTLKAGAMVGGMIKGLFK